MEAGFIPKTVRWLIVFDEQGRFLNVVEQTQPGGRRRGRTFPKVPHLKFSGDTPMRQFLVDSAHYALLYGVEKPDDKLLAKHRCFLELLSEAAVADPIVGVLARAIADEAVRSAICAKLEASKAKPEDNVTFAIQSPDGVRVLVEETTWHDW